MALNIELQMNTPENVALNTSGVPEYAPMQHYHTTLGTSNKSVIAVDTTTMAVVEGGSGGTATGYAAHAEGNFTKAFGDYSHAEGSGTQALRDASHAEGYNTKASGDYAHAEGYNTQATEYYSHAEGNGSKATGTNSHAEGNETVASGTYSHAEGREAQSSGLCSHAEGYGTIAASNHQHVQGKFNEQDSSNTYAHIVGGGIGAGARKNIHTLDWHGNAMFAGGITFYDQAGNEHTLDEILERLTALES